MNIFSSWILLAGGALTLSAAEPLLVYSFDEAEGKYLSGGTVTAALEASGRTQAHGAAGSGVSGKPADRAWDASANTTQSEEGNDARLEHAGNEAALDALSAFTIVLWYKADQPLSSGGNRLFFNLSESANAGVAIRSIGSSKGATRGFQLMLGDGSQTSEINSELFPAGAGYNQVGAWVFLAVTWDGRRAQFYQGTTDSSVLAAGEGIYEGGIGPDSSPLILGNKPGYHRGFDGCIDNFRLYGEALSEADLEALREGDSR